MHGNRILLIAAAGAISCLTACSDGASDVAPPAAAIAANAAAPTPTAPPAPVPSTAVTGEFDGRFDGDAAVTALRGYLREQALAINAGVADAAAVPAFTATLTPNGRSWALPLLAANLGDRMPGPYPVGVLASTRAGDDRVELDLCLQDRGWQVDRTSGEPVNAAHYGGAHAVVLRVGDAWLVDDLATTGADCGAGDVVEERF